MSTLMKTESSPSTLLGALDGFIKFILGLALTIVPFLCQDGFSFIVVAGYLILITLVSRIKMRTLTLSALSFGIIVVLPYLFGLVISWAVNYWAPASPLAVSQEAYPVVLRLFRLFVIWYVSILYFHTTSMKTVIGLLDKAMTPLKWLGVAVNDYLKVVTCVLLELQDIGSDVRQSLGQGMQAAAGRKQGKFFKLNVRGISNFIVSIIVNSFDRLTKIESRMDSLNSDDFYSYRFKISKADVVATLSLVIVISGIAGLEKGLWF